MTEKRDAAIQKLKAKINEWTAEIDRLAAKAEKAEAEAGIRYRHQVEDVKAKRQAAEEKLENLRDAGESAWGGDQARD